jgi:predicted membrane protein
MKHRTFFVVFLLAILNQISPAKDRLVEYEKSYAIDTQRLRVNLDIDGAEVEIVKSRDANRCYVMIEYPEDRCEVDVQFNKNHEYLEICIDHEWLSGKDTGEHDATRIKLELPQNPEISLVAEIKAGEVGFELGDLRIHDFELRNWAGEIRVNFAEPNRIKMENFIVNVKIGEVKLSNLGNANCAEADINGGIGELTVDFQGEKLDKCKAYIDLDIGETTVILPEDLGLKMKVSKFLFLSEFDFPDWLTQRGAYYYSENYEETNEHLNLTISTGIGEFKIRVK